MVLRCAVVALAVAATWGRVAQCREIEMTAAIGTPFVKAGAPRTAYVKVRLRGFEIEPGERAPVNVAIVLDKSGSMSGEKLERAKDAACMVMDRLNAQDIVSVIAYDTTVSVLVPATKVADRAVIMERIRALGAGGNTALFAGVSKGAAEARKFLDLERVNRIVLLSDGLANVGPSAPEDLGDLGASLFCSGICVTTIGLGLDYNEDLMALLAKRSNGSHLFAAEAGDLAHKFNLEFGDVLTAVAQDAGVSIECAPGVRPVRVLGREGSVDGQRVTVDFGQLFSGQDKYVIVELEVPAGAAGEEALVGEVESRCLNLISREWERHTGRIAVKFTDSDAEVEQHTDANVMVSVVRQIGAERNAAARVLRDQGKIEEARRALVDNSAWFFDNSVRFDSEQLREDAQANELDAQNLDDAEWRERRKVMLENQSAQQLQSLGYVE
ncbi:MAG: VWA domain-containing protein [Candidatus Hydrogenedentes bacterium]|nr:VWA domain-containing protein [Candidatus Hydrogenedentota bacterium]